VCVVDYELRGGGGGGGFFAYVDGGGRGKRGEGKVIAFYKFMYFINVLFLATLVVTLMC
jgi:hypothetical protein